ncbi:MAG TPA: PEP-CTERM sorting domain-containing protein [Bryobacteraceae bacterium]|nr:PEP-CTERM sorting domain-containing protein [Bryobacteraceae bacterium]
MERRKLALCASIAFAVLLPSLASAGTINFNFSGPGVSGTVQLTYGTATDATYPQAFEVTGITGTFSDSNNGLDIVNASIGPLVAITHSTPEPTNLLAPNDFSRFAVAAGLPAENNGFLTYDNLYYPGGSPQTASDYPLHGGILDIYGLLFSIGGGTVVDLFSNGNITGTAPFDYGVAVATSATALDYVSGGVTVTPEPGAFGLLGSGLIALMLCWRRVTRRN